MIRSAVTISLVPEARGGPFVFWDDLAAGCRKARALGFDAVEVFPPSADGLQSAELKRLMAEHGLRLAAVGTGAGWVVHKLRLTDPDAAVRAQAREFVMRIIEAAGSLGAPAIIGSMQGRWGDGISRETALGYLADALNQLGEHARRFNVPLFFEPLNRYETNLVNTIDDGVKLLASLSARNVKLLADLFHMNIEEQDMPAAIRAGADHIGHVHLADSNRRPAGCGHTDFRPIAAVLRAIGYEGYVSAECFPYPDPDGAARLTIDEYRAVFAKG
jgi:sugar phosphate isomerase/epimerase